MHWTAATKETAGKWNCSARYKIKKPFKKCTQKGHSQDFEGQPELSREFYNLIDWVVCLKLQDKRHCRWTVNKNAPSHLEELCTGALSHFCDHFYFAACFHMNRPHHLALLCSGQKAFGMPARLPLTLQALQSVNSGKVDQALFWFVRTSFFWI